MKVRKYRIQKLVGVYAVARSNRSQHDEKECQYRSDARRERAQPHGVHGRWPTEGLGTTA